MRIPAPTIRRPVIEDLEPRILFSADNPVGLIAATLHDPNAPIVQQVALAAPARLASAAELVFIDQRVEHRDQLLADIAAQAAAGRTIEAIELDPTRDGITQIGEALAARSGVTAVHLISHGSEACVLLGGATLDNDTLLARAGEIAAWGPHLTAGADLLLYGCDVGANADGRALVDGLAQLTGADVAASNDATGHPLLGGNWALEVGHGTIDAAGAIDAAGQAAWQNELAAFVVSNTNDSGAGSLRQAIIFANNSVGSDTISFNIAGGGVHTINLLSALPTITTGVTIDGYTQAGAGVNTASVGTNAVLTIELNGAAAGAGANGLTLGAGSDGSTIRGLVVNGFDTTASSGILVSAGSGQRIVGNFLGTNTAGTTVAANYKGISVDTAANVQIGGSTLADRNLISGNLQDNIAITQATGTLVRGNDIGTNAAGSVALGSTVRGVYAFNASGGAQIGGSAAGAGNVIAGGLRGVAIEVGGSVAVLGNSIYGSSALSIDLNGNGVSANDAGDFDSGPNDLQNFPVLTSAHTSGIAVAIAGTLNSTPNSFFRIELFASDTANGSGFGGGQRYLGFVDVATDGAGNASLTFSTAVAVSAGTVVSATATQTDPSYTTFAGTSEFAQNVAATSSAVITSGAAVSVAENTSAVTTVTATGSGITYQIIAGADAARFTIDAGTGALSFVTPPDFEAPGDADGNNVYEVVVRASDGPMSTAQAIAVTVTDVSNTLVVTTAADSNDAGIGDYDPSATIEWLNAHRGADGAVSLREAIIAANNSAGADTISFNIAGAGLHTIYLASALPYIMDAVTIDGTTQAGSSVNTANTGTNAVLTIALDGSLMGGNRDGISLKPGASGSTIRGLVIANFNDPVTGGVAIAIDGVDDVLIAGNFIGTDASGSVVAANYYGILVGNGATNLQIGSAARADRNLLVGNLGPLLYADSSVLIVRGNLFGTLADGVTVTGTTGRGMVLSNGGDGTMIGGTGPGDGNVFAGFETAIALRLGGLPTNASVLGNSIYGQSVDAIDLNDDDLTPNDPGDADIGTNDLQNFPVLTSANASGASIAGMLDSAAGSAYRIEFFASASGNAFGHGGGQRYLGYVNVTTDGSGHASFSAATAGFAAGEVISATATQADAGFATFTATSEFAQNIIAIAASTPVITSNGGSASAAISVAENTNAVTTVTATGSSVTYSILAGNDAGRFTIDASTGVLRFLAAPDFEHPHDGNGDNVYDLIVQASDGMLSDTQAITITVSNLNEAPMIGAIGAGKTWIDFGGGSDWLQGLTLQPDGKIVAVGSGGDGLSQFAIARQNADGTPDTGFGVGGKSTTVVGADYSAATRTAVQSDGKIVVAGYYVSGATQGYAVVRYHSDGSLDSSFGSGGFLLTVPGDDSLVNAVRIQADGKILVSGTANIGGVGHVALVRYNADGSLDAGFGLGGILTATAVDGIDVWSRCGDMALQADGKIVVAASALSGSIDLFALLRFNADGSADTTFNGAAPVITAANSLSSFANGIALQADGKIIVAGGATDPAGIKAALVRYNADGTLDTSFNGSGMTLIDMGGAGSAAMSVVIRADGKIIASGYAYSAPNSVAVAYLNADGTLDTNVGGSGIQLLTFVAGGDFGTASALTPAGQLIVGALMQNTDGMDFGLLRLNTDGSLDGSFGGTGTVGFTEGAAPVVLSSSANVFDAELNAADDYGGATLTLQRHGGANAQDQFSASGALAALVEAGSLRYNGVTVGTVLTNSAGTLTLRFDPGATQAQADAVLRSIAYANNSDSPPARVRIDWSFSDGNSGAQGGGGALAGTSFTLIDITPTNDAPVLAPAAPVLATITEDDTANAGQSVAAIVGTSITDPDSGALQGIAIIGSTEGNGAWEFSYDGGASWIALGTVTPDAAGALRAIDRLRFVPNGAGGTTASLTYRAWDQTSGSAGAAVDTTVDGGTSAFSTATDTATLTVTDVNDAPSRIVLRDDAGANLVVNGDFENNNAAPGSWQFGVNLVLPGWTGVSSDGMEVWNGDTVPGTAGPSVVELDVLGQVDGIQQSITTSAGQDYVLSLDYHELAGAGTSGIEIYWNDQLVASVTTSDTNWQTVRTVVTGTGGADRLRIMEAAAGNNGYGTHIDNVRLQAASATPMTVAENATNGTVVGSFARIDPDLDDSATWSLTNPDGRFAIDAATGVLSVADGSLLDFESATSHSVTVRVTDSTGLYSEQSCTVNVTNQNEAPLITSDGGGAAAAIGIAENTNTVTTVAASDVDGPALSYSIASGADAAHFTIDAVTGALSFIVAPDFENPLDAGADNVYDVIVQASDGTLSATQAVAVTVSDVSSALVVTTAADNNDAGIVAGAAYTAEWLNAHAGADGAISLREAIVAANNTAGADTISFNIAGAGVHSIDLAAALPVISDRLTIDGYTQPGTSVNSASTGTNAVLSIRINGVTIGATSSGLVLGAGSDDSTIRGLMIAKFTGSNAGIDVQSDSNIISGNFIGVGAAGMSAGWANGVGVRIDDASGTVIGGASLADRNLIAANITANVIVSGGTGATIQGNLLGTDITGTGALGGTLFSVTARAGATGVLIGGIGAGQGNVIAGANQGVTISGDARAAILGNAVLTTGLGIDLDGDGVTENDAGDADTGSNGRQNFPALTGADTDGSSAVIKGTLESTPNSYYRIEFFANASAGASGHGAGARYLGYVDVATDASGHADFGAVLASALAAGEVVSATASLATDVSVSVFTVTSEFAADVVATPVVITSGASASVAENTTAVTTVVATGTGLTYGIAGGADAARFTIDALTGTLAFIAAPDFEAPTDAGADNVYDVIVRASDGTLNTTQAIAVTVTDVSNALVVTTVADANDAGIVAGAAYTAEWLNAHAGADGAISLREAIIAANNSAGTDTISFNIAGTGVHTIALAAALPAITDALAIDGYTQAGASVNTATIGTNAVLTIELDGSATGAGVSGLVLGTGSDGSTIRGLVINRFAQSGIAIVSSANVIVGNFIGTSTDGLSDRGNASTGVINYAGSGTRIGGATLAERNLIAGNDYSELLEFGTSSGFIYGNYIGTDATGSVVLGTSYNAVAAYNGGSGIQLGGILAGQGNVVAGSITGASYDSNAGTMAILGNAIYGSSGARIANVLAAPAAVLTTASTSGTVAAISGTLDLAANSFYRVELFANTPTDASGHGAGQRYLGFVNAATDGAGHADFEAVLASALAVGEQVGATVSLATDASTSAFTLTWAFAADLPATPGAIITSSPTVVVTENTAVATTVVASGSGLVYSLVAGGADNARFTIDAATGVLRFVAAPDFENPVDADADNLYHVIVRAGNGALSATQALTITVTDANDAPVITSDGGGAAAAIVVAENGTAVTTVTATDADRPAQALVYSLAGTDAACFTIDAATGVLRFVVAPDFEAPADADADNVYELTVRASDGIASAGQTLRVSVGNVAEAPVFAGPAAFGVAENTSAVATLVAGGEGATPSYRIAGGADAARFTIDAASGTLSFVAAPDFERPLDANADNVYELVVEASDGLLSTTRVFSIDVTPLDDNAPRITSDGGGAGAMLAVAENTAAVTTVTAADDDLPATTLVYRISGGADAAAFVLDARSGELHFARAPDYEAPTDRDGDNVYELTVEVSDGTWTATQRLRVAVTPVNDNAPTIGGGSTGDTAVLVTSNGEATAVIRLQGDDADLPSQTLRYAIVGGADAARFTIDARNGELAFIVAPVADARPSAAGTRVYDVIVEVDDGSHVTTQRLSVQVELPGTMPGDAASEAAADTTSASKPTASKPTPPVAEPAAKAVPVAPVARLAPDLPALLPADVEPVQAVSAVVASTAPNLPRIAPNTRVGIEAARRHEDAEASHVAAIVNRVALPGHDAHGSHVTAAAMANTLDAANEPMQLRLRAATSVGVVVSLGIVGWAARGVSLVTSMLVASPAWRSHDLLPVLRRRAEDADWGDDDDGAARRDDDAPREHAGRTGRRDQETLELM